MADANDAADYIGSIQAQFAVSSDGTAGYTLPIAVPPGIAQMQPHLALAYGTGAGNGPLGVGWSLHGLSAITRSGQTLAQDSAITPVTYGPGDRFTLDGQRLMVIAGAGYDAPDAVFHTEIETWQKVVPVYGSSTPGRHGPDAFIVHGPDGKRLEYGTTPDARVVASPQNPSVRQWSLNKVVDENGNALTITYDLDAANGVNYPTAVDYTANEAQRVTPRRHVRLTYGPRPDIITKYQTGFPVIMDRLLSAIETYVDDHKVRRYALSYEVGAATGRSHLARITEADGAGRSLPATTFEWQDSRPGIFAPALPAVNTDQPLIGVHLPMDVNGNGRTDIVNAYQTSGFLQITLFISNGAGFDSPVTLPPTDIPYGPATQLIPLDVDGDGRIDIVCATQVGGFLGLTLIRFHEQDGNWRIEQGPLYQAGPQDLPWGGVLTAMDIDGDGFVDLLYAYGSGTAMELVPLYSDGQSSFVRSSEDQTRSTAPYAVGATWLPLDSNGDGRSDLVYAYQTGTDYTFVLFQSEGRKGLRQQATSPLPPGVTVPAVGTLLAADVNGDGLADIVHVSLDNSGQTSRIMLQTLLSTGTGFTAVSAQSIALAGSTGSLRLLPGNYTGDGRLDLVIAIEKSDALSLEVLTSTGTGFALAPAVTQPAATVPSSAQVLPLDYQGSGLTALLFVYAASDHAVIAPMPAVGPYPDLLTKITEGLGGSYEIDYLPMTNPVVYTKSDSPAAGQMDPRGLLSGRTSGATAVLQAGAARPLGTGVVPASRVLDFPKYVVRQHRKNFVRGGAEPGVYTYAYVSARQDLRGRGWLGFAAMSVDTADVGTSAVTRYHQDFPLTFSTTSIVTRRATDGALMLDIAYAYESASTTAGVYTVENVEVVRKFYTFATGADPVSDAIEQRAMSYDTFGNVTSIASTGNALAAPLYTLATYDNDPVNWRLGRRTEYKRCADAAGTEIFDWHQYQYFGLTGNLATERYWNDQSREMERLTYTVDDLGNRTSVTNAAGATTLTNWDDEYHSFAAAITSPPSTAGTPLRWQSRHDAAFGTVATETDPNGVEMTRLVDGLGRPAGVDGPTPNGETAATQRQRYGSDSIGPYLETQTFVDWTGGTRWKRSYLDGFGRAFKTVSLGPDGHTSLIVDQKLDPQGRTVRRSLPYYGSGAVPRFEESRFDAYGRLIAHETPQGDDGTITATFAWTAIDKVTETQAAGRADQRITTSQYRLVGDKPKRVSRAIGAASPTTFTYDGAGRLTVATDPAGIATGVTYDTVGRRVAIYRRGKDASAVNIARFTYELAPGVTAMIETDAAGGETRFTYDPLGRLVSRRITGAGKDSVLTTLVYDDPETRYGKGHVTSVSGPDATYRYGYDAIGNTTRIETALGSDRFAVEKSFAPGGRRQAVTFPDGSVQDAVYNAAGTLSAINFRPQGAAAQQIASYEEFSPFGRPCRISYANGVVARADYDATGLLRSYAGTGPAGSLYSRRYAWNDFGGLSEAAEDTGVSRYVYDAVNRLGEATLGSNTQHFAYDAAGNIVEKDGITFINDEYRPVLGSRDGKAVFSAQYDADGNMVQRTANGVETRLRYDAENRLVEAGPVTLAYDHTGRRVRKQTAGATTLLYPAPYYEVARGNGGNTQHSIYIEDAFGLAAVWTRSDAGATLPSSGLPRPGLYFIDQDHLRSVRLQTDSSGAAATRIDYRPFGEPIVTGMDSIARKFTGARWDEDLGLYYLGARYYDPSIGRFITADTQPGGPVEDPDALNAYAYCLNDPINRFDPTGHGILDILQDAVVQTFKAFGTAVKQFFTESVPTFFQSRVGKIITSSIVDGVLVIGGFAALLLSPLAGPFAPLVATLGATALGAGIAGVTYQISSGGDIDWGEWGIQLGIGAAVGFVTGGLTSVAGAALDIGIESGVLSTALKVGTGARSLVNVATGAVTNTVGNVIGQALNNIDPYHPAGDWYEGFGSAAFLGVAFGAAGGVASEGIFLYASRALAISKIIQAAMLSRFTRIPRVPSFSSAVRDAIEVLSRSMSFNFFYVAPGVIFTGADAATLEEWHPGW